MHKLLEEFYVSKLVGLIFGKKLKRERKTSVHIRILHGKPL
jgi:hypothetical protein